ncbi:hypothetical protein M0Q28_00665 [Patescibacteria group bacterium]|jgi:hypothetical protein|nr:hypothetical protein [Patescibacteria group bacterium]
MNSFLTWGAYLIRQAAYAFTVVAGLLLLAEILLPGSVLPFFNLHALVFGVLALHVAVISFPSDTTGHFALRLGILIPCALLLAAAVLLTIWGGSASAMLLSAAFLIVMIGIVVASATTSA